MKNLLPEQRKRTRIHDYLVRLGVVALGFIIAIEVISIVALLPSYLMAHMQQSTHKQTLAEAEHQITEGGGDVARASLEDTARLISYAQATREYPRATELVALLQTDSTQGIRVEEVSLNVQHAEAVIAHVKGEATTRTALVAYTAALEADPRIQEVVLPLRDLAANQEIEFTITVTFASMPQ